jgi:hypothetical protein
MTTAAKGSLYFGVMISIGVIATGILIPASLTAFSQIFQNKADIAETRAITGALVKLVERSLDWQDRYGPIISESNVSVKQLIKDPDE